MKICKKCNIIKTLDKFGNNKLEKDGKNRYCKLCELERSKQYRENNRQKINESAKKYRKNNPENYKKSIEKYLEKNPNMESKNRLKLYRQTPEFRKKENERVKDYYIKNIEKERERRKLFYQKNKKKEREKNDNWRKNKLKNDGFFRMKKRLRDRIRDYMKGKSIGKKTKDIIGLDYVDFKNYISSKFTEGMTWDNYGEWHLDHIKPLVLSENEEELLKLNHYTNLQPLWEKDNLKKNRKYDN
jgi:hypothetical protein